MTIPTLLLMVNLAAAPALSPQLEAQARTLETQLVAPCCWSQQVSVHQSPAATEVRQDIRRRLSRGETPQQVLDAYVTQFGTHVLVVPPATGFNVMLYAVPPVALLASAGLVLVLVRRFTQAKPDEADAAAGRPPAEDEYNDRLDEELKDLD
jgi:cytochrome c-type biogenesis protein CcmH